MPNYMNERVRSVDILSVWERIINKVAFTVVLVTYIVFFFRSET